MKIYNVNDPLFAEYGKVMQGYDVAPIVEALKKTPLPEGTDYVPSEPILEEVEAAKKLAPVLYGGLPVQFGWCNGHNTKMNCLEYHRDSEFNLGTEDFILLLAKESELVNFELDSEKVKAFLVPAGVLVEVYATSLHYAPCHVKPEKGFQVMVALPQGTNTEKPEIDIVGKEDVLLRARNKWLIAHPDAAEAKDGAFVGIKGINPDIAGDL